jgi:hypothetical protein
LRRQSAHFQKNRDAAKAVFKGALEQPADPQAAAAWTMVANILINLDESLTKE